jgi:hypothetical protein
MKLLHLSLLLFNYLYLPSSSMTTIAQHLIMCAGKDIYTVPVGKNSELRGLNMGFATLSEDIQRTIRLFLPVRWNGTTVRIREAD